jgi:hypothetical protein
MPTTIRREPHTCPICSLPLTVVHTHEGHTFEYDMAEWGRLCHHPDAGSPLACPAVQPAVKGWLNGS